MKKFDQFDFEQQIMECWNVTSDVKVVTEYLLDAPLDANREDKAANMLIGIEALYNAKFEKLFQIFEEFNAERHKLLKANTNQTNEKYSDYGSRPIELKKVPDTLNLKKVPDNLEW